jgi:hypothetical protein
VLNISGCDNIRDISMLKYVRQLDISECVNITNLSGLLALRDLTGTSEYRRRMQIQSGFETFSQLHMLKLGSICHGNESKLFAELSKASLTELEFQGWYLPAATDFLDQLKSLNRLQKLCFSRSGGHKVILPGIASLGRLILNNCSFRQFSIEEPMTAAGNIPFPIYYMEVVDCEPVTEINISRPISLLKIRDGNPGLTITGKGFVKELIGEN